MTSMAACTAWLGHANCRAFLRVIREGESNQTDAAYTVINGGEHFNAPPWRHPFYNIPTTQGGKASGAYQFLGTTWARIDDALDLAGDFSPASQDVGAVYLIAGRGAIAEVLAGDLPGAIAKLEKEWTSLPLLAPPRVQKVFAQYGGTEGLRESQPVPQPPPIPIVPAPKPSGAAKEAVRPAAPSGGTMPILALISAFGPLIAQLIPQVASIFKPTTEVSQRNVALAQTVFDTITAAAGAPNIQAAVEKMQGDPEVVKTVTQAVLTQPDVMVVLEIGAGGIKAAADRGIAMQNADRPFWLNPVVWVTVAMLPIMYLITYQVLFTLAGPYMVSNGVPGSPLQPNPWYAVVGFDPNTRTGLINLIVGFVFGGVCGIWFGTTVAKQRDQSNADQAAADAAAVAK